MKQHPSIELSLSVILREFSTEDINEIRVIDSRNRVLATSESNNQSMVGQRSTDDEVRKAIISRNNVRYDFAIDKTDKATRLDFGDTNF